MHVLRFCCNRWNNALEEAVVKVNRSAKVVKGGRRFGFSALVVVGNGQGVLGLGFGKAAEVPVAVEKAVSDAKKRLVRVSLRGTTVPHATVARFRASTVKLLPQRPAPASSPAAPCARCLSPRA